MNMAYNINNSGFTITSYSNSDFRYIAIGK